MNLASIGARKGHVKAGHAKGFTLIELLVVIAIIGILSAVVLASLSTARTKGKDAAVQEQMSGMRAAAEIYYGSNGNTYGTAGTSCTPASGNAFADGVSNMKGLITASTNGGAMLDCGLSPSAWSVAATLPSGGFFCVDSTGAAKTTTGSGNTPYGGLISGTNPAHSAAGQTSCN